MLFILLLIPILGKLIIGFFGSKNKVRASFRGLSLQSFKNGKLIVSCYIMLFILWLSNNYTNIKFITTTINLLLLANVGILTGLFENFYESIEWGLASPTSPHSFTSLPAQSLCATPFNYSNKSSINFNGNLYDAESFRNIGNGYTLTVTDLLGHPHIRGTQGMNYVYTGFNRYNMAIFATIKPANNPFEARNIEFFRGHGLLGGTLESYPDNMYLSNNEDAIAKKVFRNIEAGLDPAHDVPMLLADSRQWIDLRTQYSLSDYMFKDHNDSTDWSDATITHIPICPDILGNVRPHDTGIMVHLVGNTPNYSQMNQQIFNIAKSQCNKLLLIFSEDVINEIDLLDDPDPDMEYDPDVAYDFQLRFIRRVHEFIGILHHYQIHFKNRSGPSG